MTVSSEAFLFLVAREKRERERERKREREERRGDEKRETSFFRIRLTGTRWSSTICRTAQAGCRSTTFSGRDSTDRLPGLDPSVHELDSGF